VIFAADDGTHGMEPWWSDGTTGSTVLIQDVQPGDLSSSPEGFTPHGLRIYFSAFTESDGRELWAIRRFFLRAGGPSAGTEAGHFD
jgi:ELWxxDGT repeat protein